MSGGLPVDLSSEGVLIAATLADGEHFDLLPDYLRPEHFYSEAHRRIFEAAMSLQSKGVPIDIITVGEELKDSNRIDQVGGLKGLSTLMAQAPVIKNYEAHGRRVYDTWRKRELIKACRLIEAQGTTEGGLEGKTADAWIDESAAKVFGVASNRVEITSERIGDVATRAVVEVEAAMRAGRKNGMPSGFERYDNWTGGIHRELTVLAGRPGTGKTAYAGQLAYQVSSRGHSVLFCSMEMSRIEVASRTLAGAAQVDAAKYRLAGLHENELRKSKQAAESLQRLNLVIDDQTALTSHALRSKIRRMEGELGLVIVDYLQLMRAPGAQTREQEIASIARDLKNISKDCKVPILALCQLNRSVERRADGIPMLSDLRESGEIEQAADNVVFLHADASSGQDNMVLLSIAKQRAGPTGTVEMRFNKSLLTFSEV